MPLVPKDSKAGHKWMYDHHYTWLLIYLKLPASWLFFHQLVVANNKENIKALLSLCDENPWWWLHLTKTVIWKVVLCHDGSLWCHVISTSQFCHIWSLHPHLYNIYYACGIPWVRSVHATKLWTACNPINNHMFLFFSQVMLPSWCQLATAILIWGKFNNGWCIGIHMRAG